MRTFLAILFCFSATLLCGQVEARENCADENPGQIAQLTSEGCHFEQMANDCKDWFAKNPETLEHAKDCDHPAAEEDSKSLFAACAKEFRDQWTSLFTTMSAAAENLDRCDHDIECKKQLAFESYFNCRGPDGKPQFPCADEKQLADISAGDLLRKRESLRTLAARDSKLRTVLQANGVTLLQESSRSQNLSADEVALVLKSELRKLGIKYQCYDSTSLMQMMCSATAEVVDPAMLLGGAALGLKGGKWAARILSGVATEKKIARVTSEGIEYSQSTSKALSTRLAQYLPDQKKALDKMGVAYGDLKDSRAVGAAPVQSERQAAGKGIQAEPGIDDQIEVKSGARTTKTRSAITRALEHPDFPAELERLHKEGYQVVIDPTLSHPNGTVKAVHAGRAKIISLRPDSNWATFMHEVQHQYFSKFIFDTYNDLSLSVRSGHDIRSTIPDEVRAKYTSKQIDELEKYMKAEMPEIAANERLSGMQENELYGFRRYLGQSEGDSYTDSFARKALEKLASNGTLTAPQQQILNEIKARAREEKFIATAPIAGSVAGGLAAAPVIIHYLFKPSTNEVLIRDSKSGSYLYIKPDDEVGKAPAHTHIKSRYDSMDDD